MKVYLQKFNHKGNVTYMALKSHLNGTIFSFINQLLIYTYVINYYFYNRIQDNLWLM